ncbi:MAG: hypothetical protein JW969_06650 [Spirochaetales bacterium]|nr:hypothetical protein [Spirochaetales bacterium]
MSLITVNSTSFSAKYDGTLEEKYLLLRKVYPTIQYGRDLDLERYINLRQDRGTADWKPFYNNLTKKYTEEERKLLIHILRRYAMDFEQIFSRIIERLFERVSSLIEAKIDYILSVMAEYLDFSEKTVFNNENILEKMELGLKICSANRERAIEDIHLLEYYTRKFDYKTKNFESASFLLTGYLDGSLFVEDKPYEFNIKEEEQSYKGPKTKPRPAYPKIKLMLTEDDLANFHVDAEIESEYEMAYAYFQKYLNFIYDREFATKLFYYSRTYGTNHFRIYENIKRGCDNKLKSERIFDDIFKVICNGKYVYDVNKERTVIGRVFSFESAYNQPPGRKPSRGNGSRKKTIAREQESSPPVQEKPVKQKQPKKSPKKTELPAEAPPIRKAEKPKPVPPKKKKTVTKKKDRKQSLRLFAQAKQQAGKSFTRMLSSLTENRREQNMLKEEFKNRLPEYILDFYNKSDKKHLENDHEFRQVKEVIKYIMNHHEMLLTDFEQTEKYKTDLEKLGFSVTNAYTILLQCFTDLKTDFLTGNLTKRRFSWFFNLFSRRGKKTGKN